jgi:aconitase B
MAHTKEDIAAITEEITTVCSTLGLVPFTQEDFFAYIEKLNAEANIVFNAADFPDSNFKDTFKV